MAGYSGTPLTKKLGIKENQRLALLNSPKDFLPELGDLPEGTSIVTRVTAPLDLALLFVDRERVLQKQFAPLA